MKVLFAIQEQDANTLGSMKRGRLSNYSGPRKRLAVCGVIYDEMALSFGLANTGTIAKARYFFLMFNKVG